VFQSTLTINLLPCTTVYDVTSRETFDSLPRWYAELDTYISTPVAKILVGNKVDKEYSREVSTAEGEAYAERMGSLFVEASAKTAIGVKEMFGELVEKILDTPEMWDQTAGQRTDGGRGGMPGGVQVVGLQETAAHHEKGCSC
jgi:Ras-related protein Rab-18